MYDMLGNSRYEATHPVRESLKLPQLERDATLAHETIGRINAVLALSDRIGRVTAERNSSNFVDAFRARNTAPQNPAHVFLDFVSKDGDGRPATFEGKLKAALFQRSAAGSFGAVARGTGGVGKTCARRSLSADDDVKTRFPGGVCFMSLGADARTKMLFIS